jgi:localization factor PodJL
MHNLAVLFAEGADGAPDYRSAASWFQRAAEHGMTDSQYNLAILHARGLGVDQNLAESYRWFSIAARQGDQDAGRKRDEVATRLDAAQLATAKATADGFAARSEPAQATTVEAPAGGWDAQPAEAPRPQRRPANG